MEQYILTITSKSRTTMLEFDNHSDMNEILNGLLLSGNYLVIKLEQRIRSKSGLTLQSTVKYYYN